MRYCHFGVSPVNYCDYDGIFMLAACSSFFDQTIIKVAGSQETSLKVGAQGSLISGRTRQLTLQSLALT